MHSVPAKRNEWHVSPWWGAVALAASQSLAPAAGFQFFEPLQPPRQFQAIAHRGASRQAPENSRAALRHCFEDGIEWAEIDLRLTKDGQHVLSHDPSFTDTDGNPWKFSEHTLAELAKLDAGSQFASRFSDQRLLSLKECFVLGSNKLNLYLDCKAINPEQLAREILAAGMEQQVVVYSDLANLRKVQSVAGARVALMTKWRPNLGPADWAVSNGLAAVEIDAPEIRPEVCQAFHRAHIKITANVLGEWDRPEVWERVMSAGADWLQTDLPEEVLAHSLWRRLKIRPVLISLHRGAGRYAPENTLPAFSKAISLGTDFVEFDVRTTRDGGYFLLHDGRLDRTTTGAGAMAEAFSDDVRKLSAGAKFGKPYAQIRVPSLDEFLDACAGKVELYFDAKAIPPQALAEAIRRHKAIDQTVVYQSPEYLVELKKIEPQIRSLPPLNQAADLDNLVASLKPYAVDAKWDILSPELIKACHAAGIRVFSDALGKHETVDDYLKAMDWGIDLIQTDHPLRVLRAIELWSARKSGGDGRNETVAPAKP